MKRTNILETRCVCKTGILDDVGEVEESWGEDFETFRLCDRTFNRVDRSVGVISKEFPW